MPLSPRGNSRAPRIMLCSAGRLLSLLTYHGSKVLKEGHKSYLTQVPATHYLLSSSPSSRPSFPRHSFSSIDVFPLVSSPLLMLISFSFLVVQAMVANSDFYRDFLAPRHWWICKSMGKTQAPKVYELLNLTVQDAGQHPVMHT